MNILPRLTHHLVTATARSLRRARATLVTTALIAGMAGAAPSAQGQDDAFKKGLDLRDDKQWAAVAAQMQAAIKENPKDDGHNVRYGLFGRKSSPYFPHVYLTEALSRSNNCVEAAEIWAGVERDGLLRGRDELTRIVTLGYADCEKAGVLPPAKFDPLYARARTQVEDALGHASKVSASGQANTDAWRNDMRDQYNRASAELGTARERLIQGQKTRSEAALVGAYESAARARALLVTVESSLSAAITAQQRFAVQVRDVEQLVGTAEEQDRAIDPRKSKLTAPLAGTYREGHDAVGRARTRLASARGAADNAGLTEAASLARDASTRFARVLDELNKLDKLAAGRQLSEAVSAGQEAFAFVDGAFTTLDRLASQKPTALTADKAAERGAIQKQVDAARRRFEAARKGDSISAVTAATRATIEARDRLSALIATFGPVTLADRGVNQALIDGSNQYFAGAYEQALATLSPDTGFAPDMPLGSHVHMFRAAALYALFERSGQKDQALRSRAVAEVEECRKANGTMQPDARAFGPRFISFFNGVGTQAANAAPAGPALP